MCDHEDVEKFHFFSLSPATRAAGIRLLERECDAAGKSLTGVIVLETNCSLNAVHSIIMIMTIILITMMTIIRASH